MVFHSTAQSSVFAGEINQWAAQCHLHEPVNLKNIKLSLDDDKYLKPFMQDDILLHSFDDEDSEDDYKASVDKEEIMSILKLNIDEAGGGSASEQNSENCKQNGTKEHASSSSNVQDSASTSLKSAMVNGSSAREHVASADAEVSNRPLKASIVNLSASVKKVK
ncbi:Probable protein arginine N-methyltransferase 3 [Linum grandiflorum]